MRQSLVDIYYEHLNNCRSEIAVTDLFDELTYEELENKSNSLAKSLINYGIPENSLLPISIDNCIYRTIAILGVMKAGIGYILIKPEEWKERAPLIESYLYKKILIGECENIALFGDEWVVVDYELLSDEDAIGIKRTVTENHLLCAHFTSGSTGIPKLVFLQHFDAYDVITEKKRLFEKYQIKKVVQYLSPYFAFGAEVYLRAITTGLTLFYFDDINRGNIPELFRFIRDYGIEMAELPTSLINTVGMGRELSEFIPENLKVINVAGECLYYSQYLKAVLEKENISLFCEYGSSEMMASFINDILQLHVKSNGLVSLGDNIPGCESYIENGLMWLVRKEKDVSDYYYARRHLFVANKQEEGCFNTKDIIEVNDGHRFIVGRDNRSVKVRGYRINLSEIENCIRLQYPNEIVYAGCAERNNHVKSIGILYKKNGELTRSLIVSMLKDMLEEYKIPQFFVEVEDIPMNRNGKKDKKRCDELLQRHLSSQSEAEDKKGWEKIIVSSIERYTGPLKKTDFDKNFADLGIDSLSLITIICEVEELSKIHIQLEKLNVAWMISPKKMIESVIEYDFYR